MTTYRVMFRLCCDRFASRGILHLWTDGEGCEAPGGSEAFTIPAIANISLPGGDRVSGLRRCPFCGAALTVELVPWP